MLTSYSHSLLFQTLNSTPPFPIPLPHKQGQKNMRYGSFNYFDEKLHRSFVSCRQKAILFHTLITLYSLDSKTMTSPYGCFIPHQIQAFLKMLYFSFCKMSDPEVAVLKPKG